MRDISISYHRMTGNAILGCENKKLGFCRQKPNDSVISLWTAYSPSAFRLSCSDWSGNLNRFDFRHVKDFIGSMSLWLFLVRLSILTNRSLQVQLKCPSGLYSLRSISASNTSLPITYYILHLDIMLRYLTKNPPGTDLSDPKSRSQNRSRRHSLSLSAESP